MKRFIPHLCSLALPLFCLAFNALAQDISPPIPRAEPVADAPLAGIGVALAVQDGKLVITETIPGSAATGVVRAGDRVVTIDGAPVSGTVAENAERIRGAAGSVVHLEVERFVRQSLPRGLRVPVTLTRAALPSSSGADKSSTAGYLRELAIINRHYLINSTYLPPFGTDKMSLGYRLQQFVDLEAAAGKTEAIPASLRQNVRSAIQNDFDLCRIIGTWDEDKLDNLRDLHDTAAKTGINLFRSGDVGDDFRGFAGRVLSRSFETMAAYSAYSRRRTQQDPHSAWASSFSEISSTPPRLAPFGMNDLAFLCNPHWQFLRENEAPTDRKKGYGVDYPTRNGASTEVSVPINRGMAKIRINNVRTHQYWYLRLQNAPKAKYFFAMIEMEDGVLGIDTSNGPPCTWASAFDAWEFNHGVIGGSAGNTFGMRITHLPLPVLGQEGQSATGNVYVWFTDELNFPEEAREMKPTVTIGD
ncbi:MAG: PDZ domain-containing protein [Verrucomicrobia bacterium]|nr:PDZ domain-containing protein [Verrucomicrobiota bacterium]